MTLPKIETTRRATGRTRPVMDEELDAVEENLNMAGSPPDNIWRRIIGELRATRAAAKAGRKAKR